MQSGGIIRHARNEIAEWLTVGVSLCYGVWSCVGEVDVGVWEVAETHTCLSSVLCVVVLGYFVPVLTFECVYICIRRKLHHFALI